jgi:hypothetical protein
MRLVAFADSHQFHDELVVPGGDVVISAGDVGRAGDFDEIERFLDWFAALPHAHRLLIPGNHDGCLEDPAVRERLRERYPSVQILVDAGVTRGDCTFWGAPWTPEFHDWAFMKPRGAALAERWALIPPGLDVLVTHGPPQRVLDDVASYRFGNADLDLSDDDRYAGCADLRERVRVVRPRVHLFGHIHTQRGTLVDHDDGVVFVNCTTSEGEHPPVVIDVDAHGVRVIGPAESPRPP